MVAVWHGPNLGITGKERQRLGIAILRHIHAALIGQRQHDRTDDTDLVQRTVRAPRAGVSPAPAAHLASDHDANHILET